MDDYAFDLGMSGPICKMDDPLLRWAGGKRRLLSHIIPLLPTQATKYIEPFFGGGALFFALSPKSSLSIISDSNKDLINCYSQIIKDPEQIIDRLSDLDFSKDTYYCVRSSNPSNELDRAVRFIYLNRTCWNGLYRVNKNGLFNVPIGRFTSNPTICDPDKILMISKKLSGVRILNCDFEECANIAEKGDFVYFDPPYISKHENNGFKYYNEVVFMWEDQERLAKLSRKLRERGVNVMISNSANIDVLNLFDDFKIYFLKRKSIISGSLEGRSEVSEVIITSY